MRAAQSNGLVPILLCLLQPLGAQVPTSVPRPSSAQLRYLESEIQCFHHFGVNTYTDREWGLGDEDPEIFQPAHLNTTQWMEACADLGAKQSILVAKHHDGFMLYPTQYTNHSVVSSSWRGGRGDVVADFVQSAREVGIDPAFYLSPWDRNQYNMSWRPSYNQYYEQTFRVLLERYGSFFQLWWDGANGGGLAPRVYDWEKWLGMLRTLQPWAVGGGCGSPGHFDCGPDTAWIGNEGGYGPEDLWLSHAGSIEFNNSTVFAPFFTDVSIRRGWFYHPSEDFVCSGEADKPCNGIKSLEQLVSIYFTSVGRNSVLQLNIPPNRDGLLSDGDVAQMRSLGAYIRKTFSVDFATNATASTELPWAHADQALTDDLEDYWEPSTEDTSPALTISLRPGANTVMLQEAIQHGQRVLGWTLVGHGAGPAGSATLATGVTIGNKRLLQLNLSSLTALTLNLNATVAGEPVRLRRFGAFYAPDPKAFSAPDPRAAAAELLQFV